jgi:hypothetical protein
MPLVSNTMGATVMAWQIHTTNAYFAMRLAVYFY